MKPCLAVVLVGDDPASRVYVNNKKKGCEKLGIRSLEYTMPKETTQAQLLELIDALNEDKNVHGILVQLPLPKHLDEKTVIRAIRPEKDVDAFHPVNVGKIMIGDFDFLPCTPAGIMELNAESGTDLTGKECVVIGRSNIVGKPMAMLLLHQNATVTICHSKTRDLKEVTRRADVLVAAVGQVALQVGRFHGPQNVVDGVYAHFSSRVAFPKQSDRVLFDHEGSLLSFSKMSTVCAA